MSEVNTTTLLLSRRYSSFEDLAAMVVAWDFDFHQLSKNYSVSSLDQLQAGNILFSHLTCGCFSTHAGRTPEDMYTIALPDETCPEFRYFGHHVDQSVFLFTEPGQCFDLSVKPGYGISAFSIPVSIFEQYFEANTSTTMNSFLGFDDGIIPADPEIVAGLRSVIQSIFVHTNSTPGLPKRGKLVQSYESRLLENFLNSIQFERQHVNEPGVRGQSRILKRALDFIAEYKYEPLSVHDLTVATNLSERTLERLFNREFGISPKKYLIGQRMSGAHRQLWQSDMSETSVAEIVNTWGFWHMGQFAKDYCNLFGELPSDTLRRSVKSHSH